MFTESFIKKRLWRRKLNRSEDAVLSDTVTAIWSGTGFERTGQKTPRERHCGRKDAPKRLFISRVDESQPLESYLSEKVGGKRERGDSPFMARGRRIARKRATAQRALSSLWDDMVEVCADIS